jgi:hypothetical protein
MQSILEFALTLPDSQNTISSDASVMVKDLCHRLKGPEHRPANRSSTTFISKAERFSGQSNSSEDEAFQDSKHAADQDSVQKKFKPPSSKKQQLSNSDAIEIFQLRPKNVKTNILQRGSMVLCKTIAPKYGVSPKTIRDIWRGRTWLHATGHLWSDEEASRPKTAVLKKTQLSRAPRNDAGQRNTVVSGDRLGPQATPYSVPWEQTYLPAITVPFVATPPPITTFTFPHINGGPTFAFPHVTGGDGSPTPPSWPTHFCGGAVPAHQAAAPQRNHPLWAGPAVLPGFPPPALDPALLRILAAALATAAGGGGGGGPQALCATHGRHGGLPALSPASSSSAAVFTSVTGGHNGWGPGLLGRPI